MERTRDNLDADAFADLVISISVRMCRFECSKRQFIAVPQEDWITAEIDRADLKLLHRHIAGRVEMGGTTFVIFGYEIAQLHNCVDASIAQILTRRELQVAMFVAQGKADKEIARHLGISDHTVREHLRRACAKLSVSKRSALVASIMRPAQTSTQGTNYRSELHTIKGIEQFG